jgi:predicted nucleic acid-binding protein
LVGGEVKKLKLYLDTSIISHLEAPDIPEKMEDSIKLWTRIKNDEYDVYISPIVLLELYACSEPKRSTLARHLRSISYTELLETDEVIELANEYINAGILKEKSFDDCQHIAYACVYNCDMVISWNFKHMVNIKTISGIKSVNAFVGYKEMPIYTPTMLVEGDNDDK